MTPRGVLLRIAAILISSAIRTFVVILLATAIGDVLRVASTARCLAEVVVWLVAALLARVWVAALLRIVRHSAVVSLSVGHGTSPAL
jgi:hypothetical protein